MKEETFTTTSGRFQLKTKVNVVTFRTDGEYDTSKNGKTCATHVTVMCQKTGEADRHGLPIFQDDEGNIFVFWKRQGTPWNFGAAEIRCPA